MGLLVQIIVVLIVVGLVLYLINSLIPMDPRIRMFISALVVLLVCLWLLSAIGMFGGTGWPRLGHLC